jgi:hypothetical protein
VALDELMGGLGDFYPGSKERRDAAPSIAVDRASPAQLVVHGLGPGVMLMVNGVEVEFFLIGQLAKGLNRKPGTIRMWEDTGILPPSGYTKPGKDRNAQGKRRLWTRRQVEGIVRIALEEDVWYPNVGRKIGGTRFTERVNALFKALKKEGM